MSDETQPINAIDLFAGLGGSTRGAFSAGVTVKAAVDYWTLAKEIYTANFPDVNFFASRCESVDPVILSSMTGKIDLIIASPECTSHTCAKGNAPRSEASRRTAYEVIRFAEALKPRWVVVENVVHMRSWSSYKPWINRLKELGYNVTQQVINAADHGVPQARRRLFVLCDRKRMPPLIPIKTKIRKTAASVIEPNGLYPFSSLLKKGRAVATIERANRAISVLGDSKPFLLVYYGSDAAGGWQRLDVPLRTLTTLDRFAYVRRSKTGHEMRMLQVPEIKQAMGFPKSFRIEEGTRRERIKLLGNAVCPPVMHSVLKALIGSREK